MLPFGIGVYLADVDGMHALFCQDRTIGGIVWMDEDITVAVGLDLVNPPSRYEGTTARHAQRRWTIRMLKHRAPLGQSVHIRCGDKGMPVHRREKGIVLVRDQHNDICHDRFLVLRTI